MALETLHEGFYLWKNQKFGMTLENGYAVEIGIGPKHYCANFDKQKAETIPLVTQAWACPDCEVMIYKNGKLITNEFFLEHCARFGFEADSFKPGNLFHILNIINTIPKD